MKSSVAARPENCTGLSNLANSRTAELINELTGWVDMALAVPVMDTTRARTELGWRPERTSADALLDLLKGMREGAGLDTPPLEPGGAGPLRVREFASGVGERLG